MKKAIKWLEVNELAFEFHDYRKDGISEEMVRGFGQLIAISRNQRLDHGGNIVRNMSII